METGKIILSENGVFIYPVNGTVWLTQYQIAHLFGAFTSTIGSNIRSIFKTGLLNREEVMRELEGDSGTISELYNLEMITALAFRIPTEQTELFRAWILERALSKTVVWKLPLQNAILH